MSGQRPLRLFFGVPLFDESVLDLACAVQDQLREAARHGPRVRWVERPNLHLTLKFIGDTPAERLREVIAIGEQAAAEIPPVTVELRGAGCFPPRGAPRTLWLGLREECPELARLAETLDRRLAEAGIAEPERRPFTAHLTIGRVKDTGGGRELREATERLCEEPIGTMAIDRFVLYSSELTPRGPVYTKRGEFHLGACPPGARPVCR
ncbi:MAG TPA: RNA 2',3'-cyclic phosphodiesterase [Armatimonadetes bacterium]|nr:RNA 2',3'-cyclic phosphodiesterase [Armatimonadota bacterium]